MPPRKHKEPNTVTEHVAAELERLRAKGVDVPHTSRATLYVYAARLDDIDTSAQAVATIGRALTDLVAVLWSDTVRADGDDPVAAAIAARAARRGQG